MKEIKMKGVIDAKKRKVKSCTVKKQKEIRSDKSNYLAKLMEGNCYSFFWHRFCRQR